jgi:bifunctional ADP-heptose synthase (sugar kinase/adenylyltransferase)
MRENLKYLVVGDTIIDENIYLTAIGLSLESPTIKTNIKNKVFDFGGAANVAKYLKKFGVNVTFATSMCDSYCEMFETFYQVPVKNFYQGNDNIKSRYWISHGDETYKHLQINDVNPESSPSMLELFDVDEYDIIAFSDYRCGFITETFIKHVTDSGKITYSSSQISIHQPNYDRYWEVDYFVCNQNESKYIDRKTNICITKGELGCTMNGIDYKGYPVKVANTIGAGDCFYAALLASGDPDFANKKASEYVETPLYE